ncbi:hypothetical protein GE09DRAFT_1215934 [Coniochaeta sp. 2T2.1]|nr:hypothetical protein GE09DRAFT_1215934 [Coniochaeta sp. 2T2.1]
MSPSDIFSTGGSWYTTPSTTPDLSPFTGDSVSPDVEMTDAPEEMDIDMDIDTVTIPLSKEIEMDLYGAEGLANMAADLRVDDQLDIIIEMDKMNFDFPAQPAQALTPTVYDLLGLFKGHKKIPFDLALKVLGTMPVSAALAGLDVMDDSHIQAAELDGYIQGCFHGIKAQGRDPDGTEAFIEVLERIKGYLRDKGYCNSPMSLIWKSCAIGVLIAAVKSPITLANQRPRREDKPYLDLMTVVPEPCPANQAFQGNVSPYLNMNWFAAGFAQAQATAPFVGAELPGDQPHGSPLPQQGPYMSGGLSGLNISPSPQPNQFHQGSPNPSSGFSFPTPGSASVSSATLQPQHNSIPSFNSPPPSQSGQHSPFSNTGGPSPSQSPFFNNDDSAYGSLGSFTPSPHQTPFLNQHNGFGSMPATPQSPANSLLSSGSPNPPQFDAPQWNTPARTLSPMRSPSPLSNVFTSLQSLCNGNTVDCIPAVGFSEPSA